MDNINEKYDAAESSSSDETELYNEKNDAVIAPDSYYKDLTLRREVGGEERYDELFDKDKPKTYLWSVIALVLSLCSVLVSIFHWIGAVLAVAAIVFAVIARVKLGYFDTFTVIAIIASIFGVVFCVANVLLDIVMNGGLGIDISPNGNGTNQPPSDI